MSTPLFFPPPAVVEHIATRGARTLRELLAEAGAPCRASGPWTERLIRIVRSDPPAIEKEPGDWTPVCIHVPASKTARDAARFAVAAMAYGLMDLVARQSIRGLAWAQPASPRGRPKIGAPRTNRQRQRAYRTRRSAQ